jgi:hypothetical protein
MHATMALRCRLKKIERETKKLLTAAAGRLEEVVRSPVEFVCWSVWSVRLLGRYSRLVLVEPENELLDRRTRVPGLY